MVQLLITEVVIHALKAGLISDMIAGRRREATIC
jgi:hypothetical protein